MTLFAKATPAAVRKAAAFIRGGGTAVFPTETVYGLGADALNAKRGGQDIRDKEKTALRPAHRARGPYARPTLARVSPGAEALMKRFWPGPLTLVLPKRK